MMYYYYYCNGEVLKEIAINLLSTLKYILVCYFNVAMFIIMTFALIMQFSVINICCNFFITPTVEDISAFLKYIFKNNVLMLIHWNPHTVGVSAALGYTAGSAKSTLDWRYDIPVITLAGGSPWVKGCWMWMREVLQFATVDAFLTYFCVWWLSSVSFSDELLFELWWFKAKNY